jgi:hypothetical protein
MVSFFRRKLRFKYAKYDSTRASGEFMRGANGQRGKTRKSEIAYTSGRIRPSLASYLQATRGIDPPSSNSSWQMKERQNSVIGETTMNTQNLQTSKRFKQIKFITKAARLKF